MIPFFAFFTVSGLGKPGLAVTVDVYALTGTRTLVDVAAEEIGGGMYYLNADLPDADHVAVFKCSDNSLDAMHLPSLGDAARTRIDVRVSSRKSDFVYTPSPTADDIDSLLSANHGQGMWNGNDAVSPADIDAVLSVRHGNGLWGGSGGTGALEILYTLQMNGLPVDGARVWVSTDTAGHNLVASGSTNTFGIVTFWLDAGTYSFWRYKPGVNFDPLAEEVVIA